MRPKLGKKYVMRMRKKHLSFVLTKYQQFLTREYAKRNKQVIGMEGNFTHLLTRSITQM